MVRVPETRCKEGGFTVRKLGPTDLIEVRTLMMTTVREDFGASYDPVIHADIDDLPGWYMQPAGPFLLVAQDDATGKLLGTAGIRDGTLKVGLSPEYLEQRYRDGRTGQLVRVYVRSDERRRGVGRLLLHTALQKAARETHYRTVALHTFKHSPGAVAFWQSVGAELVEDDSDGVSGAMFFEFPSISSFASEGQDQASLLRHVNQKVSVTRDEAS